MRIWLNGKKVEVAATRLDLALEELGYGQMFIAVARNNTVVPKSVHAEIDLKQDDALEIVAPMKGG